MVVAVVKAGGNTPLAGDDLHHAEIAVVGVLTTSSADYALFGASSRWRWRSEFGTMSASGGTARILRLQRIMARNGHRAGGATRH